MTYTSIMKKELDTIITTNNVINHTADNSTGSSISNKTSTNKANSKRAARHDGLSSREIILQTAGKVFAERGYADATTKEICILADVNSAAVNYYFGGKKSLYEAVLVEAHKQIVSLDDLNHIATLKISAEDKLRAFFKLLIHTNAKSSDFWGVRVFLSELINPTQDISKALFLAIAPKKNILFELIQQITGLAPESDKIQRAIVFLIFPCIALFIIPDKVLSSVLPATVNNNEKLLEDMMRYAMGGLQALKNT